MILGWKEIVLVAIGGACGALFRHWIIQAHQRQFSSLIPYGTLFVNLSGSFVLALLWGLGSGEGLMLFLGFGFLGAFTTFSTLKLQFTQLLADKHVTAAYLYLAYTYIGGIGLAYLGYGIGAYVL